MFTTLAWDNIDRLEETLSGENTSHRVNGIAVQPKAIDHQTPKILPAVERLKKRSISTPALILPTYNVGQQVGPQQIESIDIDTKTVIQPSKIKEFCLDNGSHLGE